MASATNGRKEQVTIPSKKSKCHERRILFLFSPWRYSGIAWGSFEDQACMNVGLLVHIIYHSCLCALQSSIVPLFSCSTSDGASPYARQLSAQSALQHANAISSLLGAAREVQLDPARMPSFIGYAAYCACAVQIPFLWCSKPEIKQRAHANLLTNLSGIQGIGKHWKFIELLVSLSCLAVTIRS
jgi:hypothetical protein